MFVPKIRLHAWSRLKSSLWKLVCDCTCTYPTNNRWELFVEQVTQHNSLSTYCTLDWSLNCCVRWSTVSAEIELFRVQLGSRNECRDFVGFCLDESTARRLRKLHRAGYVISTSSVCGSSVSVREYKDVDVACTHFWTSARVLALVTLCQHVTSVRKQQIDVEKLWWRWRIWCQIKKKRGIFLYSIAQYGVKWLQCRQRVKFICSWLSWNLKKYDIMKYRRHHVLCFTRKCLVLLINSYAVYFLLTKHDVDESKFTQSFSV